MIRFKVFLVLMVICTIAGASYAQTSIFDPYNNPLFKKRTKEMLSPLLNDKSFGIDELVKGYVLLPSGEKRNGMLRFNGNVAIFQDTLADKTTRYSAKEITGFVALADTFKVYTDTTIIPPTPHMASFGDKLFISKCFLKQLIYGKKVCLYKTIEVKTPSYSPAMAVGPGGGWVNTGGGMVTGKTTIKNIFYLKRPGEIQYTLVPENKKEFKKVLAKYFRDNSVLTQDITANTLTYEAIDEIVHQYNHKN